MYVMVGHISLLDGHRVVAGTDRDMLTRGSSAWMWKWTARVSIHALSVLRGSSTYPW